MFSGVNRTKGLRSDVVSQVLLAIFRGDLKAGDRLIVQRLADDFGVSATPAREALLELAGFGAVDLLPNRGAVVRPFGPPQLREIYGVRALLETEATRLACGNIPVKKLEVLRRETVRLMEEGDSLRWSERSVRCDRELHSLIAECCGQYYLAYEIERVGKLVRVARGLLEEKRSLQELAHREHLVLIDALLQAEITAATNAMTHHIKSASATLIEGAFSSESAASPEHDIGAAPLIST
ncbi:MAG TPA: GntR family transcriptional regulator [Planctomicrobium sp.]|nr:GntR family transcriptional regulator [Planctomicrobium sp.]